MKDKRSQTINVKIRRGVQGEERYDTFNLPYDPGQSVLGVLQYITDHLDPTLGFNSSCRIGLCNSCLVKVNGKVVRSCTTLSTEDMLIEPYKDSAMVRDVIAELAPLTRK